MCFPQGRALLSRLQGLKAKGIQLRISSGMIDSTELRTLAKHSQRSLSLYYTFCVSVFKHVAALVCLFSLLTVLSPYLSCSVVSISLSLFPFFHSSVFVFHFLVDHVSVCGQICLYPSPCLTCDFFYFFLSFSCCLLSLSFV